MQAAAEELKSAKELASIKAAQEELQRKKNEKVHHIITNFKIN
jgi:hypothetical protein